MEITIEEVPDLCGGLVPHTRSMMARKKGPTGQTAGYLLFFVFEKSKCRKQKPI